MIKYSSSDVVKNKTFKTKLSNASLYITLSSSDFKTTLLELGKEFVCVYKI